MRVACAWSSSDRSGSRAATDPGRAHLFFVLLLAERKATCPAAWDSKDFDMGSGDMGRRWLSCLQMVLCDLHPPFIEVQSVAALPVLPLWLTSCMLVSPLLLQVNVLEMFAWHDHDLPHYPCVPIAMHGTMCDMLGVAAAVRRAVVSCA